MCGLISPSFLVFHQPGIPLETEPGKPPILRKPWPLPWRPSCQAQACGRCVCRCLALEIYNLWQEGGAAFGSISSVLKQRTVARASRGADKCRRSKRPHSHFSPWLPATPFLPASPLVDTCLPLAGPTLLLASSPRGRYVTYSFYLPSLLQVSPCLLLKCLTSMPSFPGPLSVLRPPSKGASSHYLSSTLIIGIISQSKCRSDCTDPLL